MSEKLIKGLVSICIPVYNDETTIRETMLSALHQSYENIEIVVVDNCSTDRTLTIVKSFTDQRIRVYRNESNIGMVGNWNRAISLARGEYMLLLCGDDRLYITSIEKKVALMESGRNVMLAFSASVVINGDNEIMMERHPFRKKCLLNGQKLARYSYLTRNIYGEPANILFRTGMARKCGAFADNTVYAVDWDMWLRLSCLGRVAYSNEVLLDYRVTRKNATSKMKTKAMLDDDLILTQNIKKYGLLKINRFDEIRHRIVIIMRTLLRSMYIMLRA